MTRIYVHIGLTKTGSTTIQDFLFNNRSFLRGRGIVYYSDDSTRFIKNDLPAALDEDFYLERSMRVRGMFRNDDQKKSHRKWVLGNIRRTIKKNRNGKIVISSEVLSSMKPKSVRKLKRFLNNCCDGENFPVRIVVYVREPVGWFTSSFQEEIKTRGRTMDEPIDLKVPYRFYLQKYIDAFGINNVDVREFDLHKFVGGSLVVDFLDAIGEPAGNTDAFQYQTRNESLSLQAAQIMSAFNSIHPLYVGEDPNPDRSLRLHKVFGAIAGDKFAIPRPMQKRVAAANKREVAWLRSVTGRPIFDRKHAASPRKLVVDYRPDSLLKIAEIVNESLLETQRLRARIKYYRGQEFERESKTKKALASYQDAVQLDPGFGPARKRAADITRLRQKLRSLRAKAREYSENNDPVKAAKVFKEIYATTNSRTDRRRAIKASKDAGERIGPVQLLMDALDDGEMRSRMVVRAFYDASEQGDHDLVAELAPAFREVFAGSKGMQPKNFNVLTWHGLVWFGDIELALDYASAPEPRSQDERSQDRETAIVVDPPFAPETGHGHHVNTNQFYLDLLSRLGAPAMFYGVHGTGDTSGPSTFDFHPALTVRIYTPRRAIEDERWLRNINEYFRTELCRQVPTHNDLYVFHSVRHTTVLGMARWMEETQRDKPLKLIVGVIDSNLGSYADRDEMIRPVYIDALAALKRLPDAEILMYCETQSHFDILNELGGEGLDIRVLPYVASSLVLDHADPGTTKSAEGDRITLGYLGGTRHERGADILPRLIRATRKDLGDRIDWSVQLDLHKLRLFAKPVVEEHLPAIESDPSVELVKGRLSGEDYFGLLERIDIVVLPYRRRYEVSGSGVFVEALSLGKVQVLPEKGWMTEDARRLGCDPVTFADATFENLSAAVKEAVERYPELKLKALKAAEIWNAEEGSAAQLEDWLRPRLSSKGH